jgi:hypothetical protein
MEFLIKLLKLRNARGITIDKPSENAVNFEGGIDGRGIARMPGVSRRRDIAPTGRLGRV